MLKFPKSTIALKNGCIAVIGRNGKPYKNKYAMLRWKGKQWSAHRLAFNLNVHPIPHWPRHNKNGQVCHRCDHRLFVVTQRYTTTWEVKKYKRLVGRVLLDSAGYLVKSPGPAYDVLGRTSSLYGALDMLDELNNPIR